VARAEVEQPPMSHGVLVVDIPSDGEEDIEVMPLAVLPSQERAMIPLLVGATMAGSSGRSWATHELVWPHPSEPGKARFILRDEEEVNLWHLLGERGLSMGSYLALTRAKLKEAMERVELVHQAMTIDLPHVAKVSFLRSRCCLLISSIRP